MSYVEKLLKDKMIEGFNINIECKGKGRVYEYTYEGSAYHVDLPLEDRLYEFAKFHGVGNTIEELLISMFEEK
jgi:hypothetical protein